MKTNILLMMIALACSATCFAQKQERVHLRKGNKLYADSSYVDAEVQYRKALEINPKSTVTRYNLGNTLAQQSKAEDALKEYDNAARSAKTKEEKAKIYHNAGVVLQKGQQYEKCIEAYKKALKANPADNETRYNLALAQKLLKDQQQNQQNQQNQQQQQQEQQQDQNKNQQNDQQQNQNQNQDKKNDEKKPENQDQQQQQPQNQMSKENAEQLLNAVKQEEKNVRDKVEKQMQKAATKSFDKDW